MSRSAISLSDSRDTAMSNQVSACCSVPPFSGALSAWSEDLQGLTDLFGQGVQPLGGQVGAPVGGGVQLGGHLIQCEASIGGCRLRHDRCLPVATDRIAVTRRAVLDMQVGSNS